jgi:hypothetical protein
MKKRDGFTLKVVGNGTSESLVDVTLNYFKALIRAHAAFMHTLQNRCVNEF